jgi:hypothetical protein
MARRRRSSTDDIAEQIQLGHAPPNLNIPGKLTLKLSTARQEIPSGLTVGWLDISECHFLRSIPKQLRARRITLSGNWNPRHLLDGISCFQLDLAGTSIPDLPADLRVEHRLDLEGCTSLKSLPDGFKVGCLSLRGCTALTRLPEGLQCYFLDISGCTEIADWPSRANVGVGRFACRGCLQLREIPPWLRSVAQLDLRDCVNIRSLPHDLQVGSWIDLAGTRIRSLPPQLKGVQIRWRGVAVDERIAFSPETITHDEILKEINAEKRRVLLERMGYDTFLEKAKAEILHEDRDAGGVRRLMRVEMKNDEALVCVSVLCPSTGRQYVIRVPPTMTTCHQAVAWVAGFDDADEYQPLAET